jgi:acetyl coenzyme A synthetase (ADP forming)-like protein
MPSSLTPFFNPKGVAVIGASSNPNKLSFGIFRNLTQYGYQGKVYPINPNAREILGLSCYPDVKSIPGEVDLAVSVVAANLTPGILEACGERGIRAVTIISGGFREVGPDGAALEQHSLEIAKRYGIRLIGPNCVGTMDLHSGLNTTFIFGVPDTGRIGFLSQSGAICGGIVDYVRGKQVGFSNFASLGNEADVTETDVIEYLADDPNTRVITAYVEAIRDGRRFLDVARRVSKIKPIVLLKAGKTDAGARAVSSHTGSIAGSSAAYKAAFHQSGVIEVESVADLFDIALALDCQPLPVGRRTVILTNSGGPAALASDSLAANGLQLTSLSEETQAYLRERLNPSAQVTNPVDMLGGAEPADYSMALKKLKDDLNVDIIIPILVPQALIKPEEVANSLLESSAGTEKTMVCCFMGDKSVEGARKVLHANRLPMYTFPESVGPVLGGLLRYGEWQRKTCTSAESAFSPNQQAAQAILNKYQGKNSIGELDTRPLLEAYGIPVIPGGFAASADEAAAISAQIKGPVVMKIVSPDILHKSDAGGIKLNLVGQYQVRDAFHTMTANIRKSFPQAHLEGVLIEQMAPKGTEVIVGMRRDPSFGPLLMFGLGGIYVELFADVAFRIAPVSPEEAREMIFETKAGKLLTGFRGMPHADLLAVVACIQKLGQLALDFPTIDEIEVNPLLVFDEGQGAVALDGRVILGGKTE